MRNKTYKLQKLEKQRYSILTNDLEHCIICGKSPVDIHEIYCGAKRQVSMKNGFCIPLCRTHHILVTNHNASDMYFRQKCQEKYEEMYSRDEFIKLIGRNYLWTINKDIE